jgi:type II secretory pathway pseudopilin PulG
MMTTLVVLGIGMTLAAAAYGYVAWRDRRRLSSAEDSAAARTARSTQERYAAERHAAQGDVWNRGSRDPNG